MRRATADHRCLDWHAPGADPYDLMVRCTAHEGVYLCDACHEAIQQEMADAVG